MDALYIPTAVLAGFDWGPRGMTIIAGNDLNDFAQVCRGSGVVGSHLQVAVDGVVAQRRRYGYLDWRFRSTRSSRTVPRLAADCSTGRDLLAA